MLIFSFLVNIKTIKVVDELSSALDKETQKEIEEMLIESPLNFVYATHKYD